MNKFLRIIVSSLFLCTSSIFADIELVSKSNGTQANGQSDSDYGVSISADGRYVVFVSSATNLVNDDTNNLADVFVHDRDTGLVERVSESSTGEQAIRSPQHNSLGATHPSISADGRFVIFSSDALNLVTNDANGHLTDTFVHDRQTKATELVSFHTNGEPLTYGSFRPSISADGRIVSYSAGIDLFVHDLSTGVVERVSESSAGERGNEQSYTNMVSSNGRFVAFLSRANNLVQNDTNNATDIFVHDRETKFTERVNVSSTGEQANDESYGDRVSISSNGRFVTFSSQASNLVPGDTNNFEDVFVHDRQSGLTERVSVSSSGDQSDISSSDHAQISNDGRFVVFRSRANDLVPGVTNNVMQIYLHDREIGSTVLISSSAVGEQGNYNSHAPSISADGAFIEFESGSNNLALDVTNFNDIFVAENPLLDSNNNLITLEKRINNETRQTQDKAAQLSTGTLYRQSYKVTNDSPNRIYQVKVFEDGNLVCNFYAMAPGQSRQRCDTFQTVLEGNQHMQVTVTAKVSGSGMALTSSTDAYYTGLTNVTGELVVTHRINNANADTADQAPTLSSQQASVLFKVENTGDIELYQVKAYHDPVSPVNSGWNLQCVLGLMKPGQVRYCKKDILLNESGINQAMGRVQGRNAIRSATDVINASNPTYYIVP